MFFNTKMERFAFKKTNEHGSNCNIGILVDKNTGVNYMIIRSDLTEMDVGALAVTPLYNADGSLIVDKVIK